jgi:hypothetical protein
MSTPFDPDQLSHEERTLLVWRLVGVPVVPWTQEQEVLALLGILSCPHGHTQAFSWAWLDGNFADLMKEGALLPERTRFETEGFDVKSSLVGTICHCYDPKCKDLPDFYVPPDTLKLLTGST